MATEPITVLLVDDEPLARVFARQHLSAIDAVSIVGECDNGDSFRDAVKRFGPTVVLLDVHMPGANVFETLDRMSAERDPLPSIIFATAFDAYAVRAFEHNAVDYLVKPYTRDRLRSAIDRIRDRSGSAARGATRIETVARDLGPAPTRLLVPDGPRLVPIPMDAIIWLQAEDDFVHLHTKDRSYLLSRSLTELEKRLDARRFLRVHRSAIVQMSRILEVRPEGSGRYGLRLEGGTTVIVSRSHAHKLRAWMA
jgi:two-component system, LytTR family, response regulator